MKYMDDRMLEERLTRLESKIDEVFRSAEKTRKYFLWTLITSLVLFVLPLLGLLAVIPSFLNSVTAGL